MKKYTAVPALILIACQMQAQSVSQKIESLINAYHNTEQFNGSVLVAQHGVILYRGAVGLKSAKGGRYNTANSIYQIGSVTKQFTSAIIMELQQEGKLSVKDHLNKYLPDFAHGDKITLEQLLTHTSGLYNYTDDTAFMRTNLTLPHNGAELTTHFSAYPLDFEPGSKWKYSNTGYFILGRVIETVTGQPYEQVVRRRIFTPLGMSNSGFDFIHLRDTNKTQAYFQLTEGRAAPAFVLDSSIAYSAGAVYTTVGDLYKWERAIYTDQILTQASWKTVFTPYRNKYGYGWFIDTAYGKTYMAHGGSIPGYFSYIVRFPGEELVVIVFDNSSRPKEQLGQALAALVLGQPYDSPAVPKETAVSAELLQQYIGVYELAPNFDITVTVEGNGLKAQATGQQAFDLYPEKENLFFLKVVPAKVEFVKDDKGVVTEMILYQNGQSPHGKKIK